MKRFRLACIEGESGERWDSIVIVTVGRELTCGVVAAQVVSARAEVIMAAGPYHSAKLLQLSGIGPADVLQPLGVDVIADLPVGESAQVRSALKPKLKSVLCFAL